MTWGGTDTEYESAQKVNSGEENSPAAPARIQTGNLSIMSPALYKQAIPASSMLVLMPRTSIALRDLAHSMLEGGWPK